MTGTAKKKQVSFYNPKEIGRTLKEVGVDLIKTEKQDVVSRWFHSPHEADLFIWQDQKSNIIKQQLSFFGNVTDWNIVDGVKTGFVLEEESDNKTIKGSELIKFDTTPNSQTIYLSLDVIDNIETLSEEDKESVKRNFSKSPKLSNMPAEQIVKKFGHKKSKDQPYLAEFIENIRKWLNS